MFLTRSLRLTPKLVTNRRDRSRNARTAWFAVAARLEERVLLSGGLPASALADAPLISLGGVKSGTLASGGADVYEIQPTQDGLLVALTSTSAPVSSSSSRCTIRRATCSSRPMARRPAR